MAEAMSANGSIHVQTTDQGLPLAVTVEPHDLRREPAELAGEILRLCRRAANRAGAAQRAELAAAGIDPGMLELTGLPREQQVQRQELLDEQDDFEPRTWMREE